MLDAAEKALDFIKYKRRSDLDIEPMLTFAIVRALEIIGEAANKITDEGRSEYSNLPWPKIIGMRNRIVHAYFDINLDRVWETVTYDLPSLIDELKRILNDYNE